MRTIKALEQKILPFWGKHSLYYKRGQKTWARDIAKFIIEYCNYLDSVLTEFKKVSVTLVDDETLSKSRYQYLKVVYNKGDSNIIIDNIYYEVLLPEIKDILKQHNKRLQFKDVCAIAA
jgi:hypothetical protein